MEPGVLTKVLHDFLTTVDGELSLEKDEHFLVILLISFFNFIFYIYFFNLKQIAKAWYEKIKIITGNVNCVITSTFFG